MDKNLSKVWGFIAPSMRIIIKKMSISIMNIIDKTKYGY